MVVSFARDAPGRRCGPASALPARRALERSRSTRPRLRSMRNLGQRHDTSRRNVERRAPFVGQPLTVRAGRAVLRAEDDGSRLVPVMCGSYPARGPMLHVRGQLNRQVLRLHRSRPAAIARGLGEAGASFRDGSSDIPERTARTVRRCGRLGGAAAC